ncbi:cytochrome P450 [Rhizobacter sp. Root1221]|nr:cytochrome P450 [Rhizobacter sp. Root1221]
MTRAPTPDLPDFPRGALDHIPGSDGWPLVGGTLRLLADPKGAVERSAAQHGPVYRSFSFGRSMISLLGPDANQFVLSDPDKVFSSRMGWNPVLELLFPRGLMLLDFDEHRLHRKAMSAAFKTGPMRSYLNAFDQGIGRCVAGWLAGAPHLRVYPAIKRLSLDLAAVSFLGDSAGPQLEAVQRAMMDMIAASVSFVRKPLPGTRMRRGVNGRKFMIDYLGRQIEARRASGGEDIFTHLCQAVTDDGALMTPEEIVDHTSFLLLAGHDTLASSLTSLVYFLVDQPAWQHQLRDEVLALGLARGEPLPFDRLDEMPLTEMAFKEALRLMPPIPSIPRRAVRDTEFGGFRLPAGTNVNVNPLYTHRMADVWPDPEVFNPLRFTAAASRERHRYAFVPFGGGAHMCIGLQFAYMQAKCFIHQLLSRADLGIEPGHRPEWQYWPIPRPRDGLPIRISARP